MEGRSHPFEKNQQKSTSALSKQPIQLQCKKLVASPPITMKKEAYREEALCMSTKNTTPHTFFLKQR